MKNVFYFVVFFFAQNLIAQEEKIYNNSSAGIDFFEGFDSLKRVAQREISYPEDALEAEERGIATIQFVVEKDGSITGINADWTKNVFFKAEVIRFAKSLKQWTPAKIKGNPVRCYRKLNVSFRIKTVDGKKVPAISILESSFEGEYKAESGPPIMGNTEEVFVVVEQQAEFPEGQKATFEWIEKTLERPKDKALKGKVILRFIVEKDGLISNVVLLRGTNTELDQLALDCIKKMPRWKPGKQRGNPVNSYFTLPVVFK